MNSTSERFRGGVHSGKCSKAKKTGYASISAAASNTDVHILEVGNRYRGIQCPTTEKKKHFSHQDMLAYVMVKCMMDCPPPFNYTIIVSSRSSKSKTIVDMVSRSVSLMSNFTFIYMLDKSYTVEITCRGWSSSMDFKSLEELMLFVEKLRGPDHVCVVYPYIDSNILDVLKCCNPSRWFMPMTSQVAYISAHPTKTSYNIFPWSAYPAFTGYTIGEGVPELASQVKRGDIRGAVNYYESLISSAPYETSCIDCYTMKAIANAIDDRSESKQRKDKHRLSADSIIALEDLQNRIATVLNNPNASF